MDGNVLGHGTRNSNICYIPDGPCNPATELGTGTDNTPNKKDNCLSNKNPVPHLLGCLAATSSVSRSKQLSYNVPRNNNNHEIPPYYLSPIWY